MKKSKILSIFLAFAMLVCIPLMFSSCSKDDDNTPNVKAEKILNEAYQNALNSRYVTINRARTVEFATNMYGSDVNESNVSYIDLTDDEILLEYTESNNSYYIEFQKSNNKYYKDVFNSKTITKYRLSKFNYYTDIRTALDLAEMYNVYKAKVETELAELNDTKKDVYGTYYVASDMSVAKSDSKKTVTFNIGYVEFSKTEAIYPNQPKDINVQIEFNIMINDGRLSELVITTKSYDLSSGSSYPYKTEILKNSYNYTTSSLITFDVSGFICTF